MQLHRMQERLQDNPWVSDEGNFVEGGLRRRFRLWLRPLLKKAGKQFKRFGILQLILTKTDEPRSSRIQDWLWAVYAAEMQSPPGHRSSESIPAELQARGQSPASEYEHQQALLSPAEAQYKDLSQAGL